ncbi:hypothetical protein F5X99DRAFT_422496 [Biscogniauxia marginata]|nr:hypothetical protein F5X99DRAFT_422496 [Biscogniauxia marginata]
MAGLPKGWESDYDGSRWFYRYKPTGLTQFNFPKPGDEFPEFVGIGFGPLDLAPEERLASEQQIKRRTSDGSNNAGNVSRAGSNGRKKVTPVEEGYEMGATGYFDPDSFMYFGPGGHNDVSPVAGEDDNIPSALDRKEKEGVRNLADAITPGPTPTVVNSEPIIGQHTIENPVPNEAYELHEETQQVWTPVGFVAELASSDTIKCADELAPIELDATSFAPAPIRTDLVHDGPVELPTHRSPVDSKPVPEPATNPLQQPVDAYPLVSASFAYPPLKATGGSATNTTSVNSYNARVRIAQQKLDDFVTGIYSSDPEQRAWEL